MKIPRCCHKETSSRTSSLQILLWAGISLACSANTPLGLAPPDARTQWTPFDHRQSAQTLPEGLQPLLPQRLHIPSCIPESMLHLAWLQTRGEGELVFYLAIWDCIIKDSFERLLYRISSFTKYLRRNRVTLHHLQHTLRRELTPSMQVTLKTINIHLKHRQRKYQLVKREDGVKDKLVMLYHAEQLEANSA